MCPSVHLSSALVVQARESGCREFSRVKCKYLTPGANSSDNGPSLSDWDGWVTLCWFKWSIHCTSSFTFFSRFALFLPISSFRVCFNTHELGLTFIHTHFNVFQHVVRKDKYVCFLCCWYLIVCSKEPYTTACLQELGVIAAVPISKFYFVHLLLLRLNNRILLIRILSRTYS